MKAKLRWAIVSAIMLMVACVFIFTLRYLEARYERKEKKVEEMAIKLMKSSPNLKLYRISETPFHWIRSAEPGVVAGMMDYDAWRGDRATRIRIEWEDSPKYGIHIILIEELDGEKKNVLWSSEVVTRASVK